MQIPMSFLETALTKAATRVWPALDPALRDEVVTMLARLIAKTLEPNDVLEGASDE